ncbi:MAG: hypothetical protein MMC23_001455 [Stictis urceolatum]|nr:hypothetical protein [Stictis urceolata]
MADIQKYTNKLQNARILIIGGSSGIGYGAAEACLESGATVTIASSNPSRVQTAVDSLLKSYPSAKSRLHAQTVSLNDAATCEANIVALLEKVGKLDHIIHTAGDSIAPPTTADGKTGVFAADINGMMQRGMVRFFAAQLLAKHAVDYLEPSYKSSLTLTTGSISEKPMPGMAVGNGFGTGLHGLARGLALDLAPIRVNAISPGGVDTPLWDGFDKERREAMKSMLAQKTCTGRIASIEDVAEAYLYVLKDWNVTGSVIRTDGGYLIK